MGEQKTRVRPLSDDATMNALDEFNQSCWTINRTHICGDTADSSKPSKTLLVLIGNKATKDGVNVKGRLM